MFWMLLSLCRVRYVASCCHLTYTTVIRSARIVDILTSRLVLGWFNSYWACDGVCYRVRVGLCAAMMIWKLVISAGCLQWWWSYLYWPRDGFISFKCLETFPITQKCLESIPICLVGYTVIAYCQFVMNATCPAFNGRALTKVLRTVLNNLL